MNRSRRRRLRGALIPAALCLAMALAAPAQAPAPGPAGPQAAPPARSTPIVPQPAGNSEAPSAYILGPDDQILVNVLDLPEIDGKTYRIDLNGFIKLPIMSERIRAAGLTVEGLEDRMAGVLKAVLRDPQVTITVVAFRSQTVSVLGSVKTPGLVSLEGRRTLMDVLASVGGLADDAGYTLRIIRRREYGPIPLPSAKEDASGEYSVAEVSTEGILDASNPAQNIPIFPEDQITVPRGQMIYVVGNVTKAGGFVLQQTASVSVLEALSLAGGTAPAAATKSTRILRPTPGGGSWVEVPINLGAMLRGKAPDIGMKPGEILYVPSSTSKKALARAADVAALVASGLIYRIP